MGLRRVLEKDASAFDAVHLKSITPRRLHAWLYGDFESSGGHVPERVWEQTQERCRLVQELGNVLETQFCDSIALLMEKANGDAPSLVHLIVSMFPGFQDHAVYRGRQVFFYKRAQILVGDIWAALKGEGLGALHRVSHLTCFADYRIPQLLEHLGILKYSPELKDRITNRNEIESGSEMELEVRSCCVQAVSKIQTVLEQDYHCILKAIEVDWLLWERGESQLDLMNPHHRCRTVYY